MQRDHVDGKGKSSMKTSPLLERYRGLVDNSQITAIYEVASSLQGLRVLHLNTTDQGGGVAEILHELLPVMEELGIRHGWKVIPLDEASGYFSARIVDMLQGYDTGEFPETEKEVFLEKLRSAVQRDAGLSGRYLLHPRLSTRTIGAALSLDEASSLVLSC